MLETNRLKAEVFKKVRALIPINLLKHSDVLTYIFINSLLNVAALKSILCSHTYKGFEMVVSTSEF